MPSRKKKVWVEGDSSPKEFKLDDNNKDWKLVKKTKTPKVTRSRTILPFSPKEDSRLLQLTSVKPVDWTLVLLKFNCRTREELSARLTFLENRQAEDNEKERNEEQPVQAAEEEGAVPSDISDSDSEQELPTKDDEGPASTSPSSATAGSLVEAVFCQKDLDEARKEAAKVAVAGIMEEWERISVVQSSISKKELCTLRKDMDDMVSGLKQQLRSYEVSAMTARAEKQEWIDKEKELETKNGEMASQLALAGEKAARSKELILKLKNKSKERLKSTKEALQAVVNIRAENESLLQKLKLLEDLTKQKASSVAGADSELNQLHQQLKGQKGELRDALKERDSFKLDCSIAVKRNEELEARVDRLEAENVHLAVAGQKAERAVLAASEKLLEAENKQKEVLEEREGQLQAMVAELSECNERIKCLTVAGQGPADKMDITACNGEGSADKELDMWDSERQKLVQAADDASRRIDFLMLENAEMSRREEKLRERCRRVDAEMEHMEAEMERLIYKYEWSERGSTHSRMEERSRAVRDWRDWSRSIDSMKRDTRWNRSMEEDVAPSPRESSKGKRQSSAAERTENGSRRRGHDPEAEVDIDGSMSPIRRVSRSDSKEIVFSLST